MHHTAFLSCVLFFQVLHQLLPRNFTSTIDILDVGSYDVNGNNRDCIDMSDFGKYRKYAYVGVDARPGPNVDLVQDVEAHWLFGSNQFDVILSTSCLEHDDMFWMTFLNMANSLRDGGLIWINAPGGSESNRIHRYVVDNYRFFPDSAYALAKWSRRNNINVSVVQSTMLGFNSFDFSFQEKEIYGDTAMIFLKEPIIEHTSVGPLWLGFDISRYDSTTKMYSSVKMLLISEFSYYKLDWMTMFSNFYLVNALGKSGTYPRGGRPIDVFFEGEVIPFGKRGLFPGVYPYHNLCIFDYNVNGSKWAIQNFTLGTSLIGSKPSQPIAIDGLDHPMGTDFVVEGDADEEFYYRLLHYFHKSANDRIVLKRFELEYVTNPARLDVLERLYIGRFQYAPPHGSFKDIWLPLSWFLDDAGNGLEYSDFGDLLEQFFADANVAYAIMDTDQFRRSIYQQIYNELQRKLKKPLGA